MMSSAVQEIGGYIPVWINAAGYILRVRADGETGWADTIVHRETRGMHKLTTCFQAYSDARESITDHHPSWCVGVLELTPDGGGQSLLVPESMLDLWDERLKFWKGCYGKWPVHPILV